MKIKFSNETYDTLAILQRIILPALATLYFALAGIWGLPYGEQIVGTIAAVTTFLGAILKISTWQYEKEREAKAGEDGEEDAG